ncbi:kelch-like protein 5 [Tripterygium wilfordii]|uniref:Kelch-like protein 5 n=1 Tax=Tripterygium wilfordii TaxID=458696 RepID=A0A7J7C4F9_TRIWF|nr:kelch-like protein 5 [Tripterygium wilfordii]
MTLQGTTIHQRLNKKAFVFQFLADVHNTSIVFSATFIYIFRTLVTAQLPIWTLIQTVDRHFPRTTTSMGSLPSPPRPTTPPPSPELAPSRYRVYASFCLREPSPNMNICNWIEFYNPSNNTWTSVTSIPGLIDNHVLKDFVMVSLGTSIYIIGGRLCRKQKLHHSDYSNDFIDEEIELDVPPNQIVAVGDRLFSSGDCLKAWKGHIEAYDDKVNIWNVVDGSHLQTLNSPISTNDQNWTPIERLYLTMVPIGAHLFFLAGYRMARESSRTMSRVSMWLRSVIELQSDGIYYESKSKKNNKASNKMAYIAYRAVLIILKQSSGIVASRKDGEKFPRII